MEQISEDQKAADRALIQRLGGPGTVAKCIGASLQRVQNWTIRGIPVRVKLAHPEMFLPEFKRQKPRSATNHPGERACDKAKR